MDVKTYQDPWYRHYLKCEECSFSNQGKEQDHFCSKGELLRSAWLARWEREHREL